MPIQKQKTIENIEESQVLKAVMSEEDLKAKYSKVNFPLEYQSVSDMFETLGAEKMTVTIEKDGQKTEHVIEANEVEQKAYLLLQARDEKALVTAIPASSEHAYVVVSGLTEASVTAMRQDGITTAMCTETSEGRFQSIVKLNKCDEEKRAAIESTLVNRYGNGEKSPVAIPSFYSATTDRMPRIVGMSTAAPAIGAARLIERLDEKASQYAGQEAAMKSYAAQQAQAKESAGQQEQEPLKTAKIGADGQTLIRSADATSQAQANQTAVYSSMIDKIMAFLRDLAKKMANLFTRAFVAAPGLSIKKHDQEPTKWLTKKGVWSEQEMSQGILPDNKINKEIKASVQETKQKLDPKVEAKLDQAAKQHIAAIKAEVIQEEAQAQAQDAPTQAAAHKRRRR